MHFDGLSDVRQHHRFHKLFTLFKKSLLLFDNAAADAQKGVVAALQALDKPARFLQVAADKLAVSVIACTVTHGGIVLVDLQARKAI